MVDYMKHPWHEDFKDLQSKMTKVNQFLSKKIIKEGTGELITGNARLTIHYKSFWENTSEPFDSSFMRGQPTVS